MSGVETEPIMEGSTPLEMVDKRFDYTFKVLVMGDFGVGKTSLIKQFCDEVYIHTPIYNSTLGIDVKIKYLEVNGKRVKLQIWDSAGQNRLQTVTQSYYRRANGIMLVYDVTSLRSFKDINIWIQDIEDHAFQGFKGMESILVGNKCDLGNIRQIPAVRGMQMAHGHEMKFVETSVRDAVNVELAFKELTESMLSEVLTNPQPQREGERTSISVGDQDKSCGRVLIHQCCAIM